MKTISQVRKLALAFVAAVFFICCNSNNQNSNKNSDLSQRKMDPVLNKILVTQFPNYTKNPLVREKALVELVNKVDSLAHLNYLDDIPLTILRINKNPHGKGALVQFYADNYKSDQKGVLSNNLCFDIIGLMTEELASSLEEKKKYFVFGKKTTRLDRTQTYLIVNQTYYSPEPEISKDVVYSDLHNLKLGVFMCEVDSVRQYKRYNF